MDLTQHLRNWGFNGIDVALSFEQTMSHLGKQRYDLVIFDTSLNGGKDRIEGLARISKIHDTIVILLASYMNGESDKYGKLYESFYFVEKPFDPEELKLSVETALSVTEKTVKDGNIGSVQNRSSRNRSKKKKKLELVDV
jgi:DNA-binding response OmpR family regulator